MPIKSPILEPYLPADLHELVLEQLPLRDVRKLCPDLKDKAWMKWRKRAQMAKERLYNLQHAPVWREWQQQTAWLARRIVYLQYYIDRKRKWEERTKKEFGERFWGQSWAEFLKRNGDLAERYMLLLAGKINN